MKTSNPNIWLPACTCKHMYIHPCEFVDTYYIHMQERRGGEREHPLESCQRNLLSPKTRTWWYYTGKNAHEIT